jgi:hypothetical protein
MGIKIQKVMIEKLFCCFAEEAHSSDKRLVVSKGSY